MFQRTWSKESDLHYPITADFSTRFTLCYLTITVFSYFASKHRKKTQNKSLVCTLRNYSAVLYLFTGFSSFVSVHRWRSNTISLLLQFSPIYLTWCYLVLPIKQHFNLHVLRLELPANHTLYLLSEGKTTVPLQNRFHIPIVMLLLPSPQNAGEGSIVCKKKTQHWLN